VWASLQQGTLFYSVDSEPQKDHYWRFNTTWGVWDLSVPPVVLGSNLTNLLLSSIINIVFYIWVLQGLMISSTVGIWTYKVAFHHFHWIVKLCSHLFPVMVFPVKNDLHRKWMGKPSLCTSIREFTPQINNRVHFGRHFQCLFFAYSLQLFMSTCVRHCLQIKRVLNAILGWLMVFLLM